MDLIGIKNYNDYHSHSDEHPVPEGNMCLPLRVGKAEHAKGGLGGSDFMTQNSERYWDPR